MSTEKPFAVFDLDGTLVRWQMYHAIVDRLARNGNIDPTSYQAVREVRLRWKRREADFKVYEATLIQTYENALASLTPEQFHKAVDETFEEHKEQVHTFTRDLVGKLKKQGYILLAISGSHAEVVERISRHYGFDDSVGTEYHYENGRFTGKKTFAAANKQVALQKFIEKHQLSLIGSIAVGDSESDIPMLEMVEKPVVFNPTKKLFEHACKKKWKVVVERKNVIYEFNIKNGNYTLKLNN